MVSPRTTACTYGTKVKRLKVGKLIKYNNMYLYIYYFLDFTLFPNFNTKENNVIPFFCLIKCL